MKFRKRPVVIDATQWFQNGDHPGDDVWRPFEDTGLVPGGAREGAVVRRFRHPGTSGESSCRHCCDTMHRHGWIDTLEGGHIVCPGDWVITGVAGEHYPCKATIFEQTYEPVEQGLLGRAKDPDNSLACSALIKEFNSGG